MSKSKRNKNEPVIIKKYSNRRLYDTEISSYVTLEDLFQMLRQGADFVVYDAKSGDDLTRNVLTQIIFEQEAKGYGMLPVSFLKQIITFYDDKLGNYLPGYLESTMKMFYSQQEQMRNCAEDESQAYNPIKMFEGMARQNMEMFKNTMKAFYQNRGDNDGSKN
jgi:polyhydroxyalkanoate synthesis repressor PhaR